jgi:hypothetical protein
VLNQAVRKNIERFSHDFMFQLTKEEYREVLRSQFVTLKRGQHSKYLPYAFTEHGILMLLSKCKIRRYRDSGEICFFKFHSPYLLYLIIPFYYTQKWWLR